MDYFNRDLLYAMYIDSGTSQVCVWGVFPPLAWHIEKKKSRDLIDHHDGTEDRLSQRAQKVSQG